MKQFKTLIALTLSAFLLTACGNLPSSLAPITKIFHTETLQEQFEDNINGVVFVRNEMRPDAGVPRSGPNAKPNPSALGTGFFVAENMIVTNHHVVDNTWKLSISTANSIKFYPAKVIRSSKTYDVAVLQILDWESFVADNPNWKALHWGDSNKLKTGDFVWSIGHPFGLSYTLATGVVSHPARQQEYKFFIQTDTLIQTGNSGGPLFNDKGEVVGINSQIIGNQIGSSFGMSLNSNIAERIVSVLLGEEDVTIAKLGIRMAPSDDGKHIKIDGIEPEGKAFEAGLAPGDVLLNYVIPKIGLAKKIIDPSDLILGLNQLKPGDEIMFTIERGKQIKTIRLKPDLLVLEKYEKPKTIQEGFYGYWNTVPGN